MKEKDQRIQDKLEFKIYKQIGRNKINFHFAIKELYLSMNFNVFLMKKLRLTDH